MFLRHRSAALFVTIGVAACAEGESSSPLPFGAGKADFYGNDDRQQIRDSQHPKAVEWARATAVIVNKAKLHSATADRVGASVSTLGEREGLCSDERFASEPAFGFCSSFLVAPDLVATAGHCFKSTLCDEMAFVFDFYVGGASGNVQSIPASNVYSCREVVAQQLDGDGRRQLLVAGANDDRPAADAEMVEHDEAAIEACPGLELPARLRWRGMLRIGGPRRRLLLAHVRSPVYMYELLCKRKDFLSSGGRPCESLQQWHIGGYLRLAIRRR